MASEVSAVRRGREEAAAKAAAKAARYDVPAPEISARPATGEDLAKFMVARRLVKMIEGSRWSATVTFSRGPRIASDGAVLEVGDALGVQFTNYDGRRAAAWWFRRDSDSDNKTKTTLQAAQQLAPVRRPLTSTELTDLLGGRHG